ncbi:hypothetical protein NNC19_17605 [Clostridium sp. SHJSY1]|uniref:hypothetical protein n=1 Tax=Clostridium sp. SHJSY1 TaxID=2942483 RepID=UPI00287540FB|nr:hypothetical protein [Clostridium sp. SHJSY1]MDS0527509.1 hypothetical protein [Clostridium sp. SHJSY1]
MSILKKIGSRCAEEVFNIAMSKYKATNGTMCLYYTYYEPEFIEELIADEE